MKKFTSIMTALLLGVIAFMAQAADFNPADFPAQLNYTTGGQTMSITWQNLNGDYWAMYNTGALTFTAGDQVITATYGKNFEESYGADGYDGVEINLSSLGLTDNTEYTLTVPENLIVFYDGSYVGYSLAASFTFTYKEPTYSYMDAATISETMSGSVETLSPVILSWGGQTVERSQNQYSCIIRNLTTGQDVTNTSQGLFKFLDATGKELANTFKGETFKVNMTSRITEKDCKYQLVLPARIVQNAAGEFNPEQVIAEFVYGTLPEPEGPKATLNYNEGDTYLTVTWDIDGDAYIYGDSPTLTAGDQTINIKYGSGAGQWTEYTDGSGNYIGGRLNLYSLPLVEGTTYTLTLPEGAFYLDAEGVDETSPAQTFEFTFKGFNISYMKDATVSQTMSGSVETIIPVQLSWGEEVSISMNQYSAIIRNLTAGTEETITSQGLFKFLDAEGKPQGVSVKKGLVMNIDLSSKITAKDAKYEIAIPAGIVTNAAGDWNPAQTIAQFVYGEDPDAVTATLNYNEGDTYLTVTWDIDGDAYIYGDSPTLTAGDQTINIKYGSGAGQWTEYTDESGNYVGGRLNLYSLPLVEGTTYTLTLPEGAFYLDAEGVDETSPEQVLEFTFNGFDISYMKDATVSQTMSGSVETIIPVQLSWGEEVSISMNQYSAIIRNLTAGTEETITSQGLFKFLDDEGNPQSVNVKKGLVMNIDLSSKITAKNARYEIAIPAGIVTNAAGDWNPAQTIAQFVYGEDPDAPQAATATLNYNEGDTYLTVTWDIDGEAYIYGDSPTLTAGDQTINIKYGSGAGQWTEYTNEEGTYVGGRLNLYSLPLVEGTTYTLTLPEGAFYLDAEGVDETSPEQVLEFTFNGFDISYMNDAEVTQTMTGTIDTLLPVQLTWGEEVSISMNQYSAIIRNLTDDTEEVITSQGLFKFLDEEGNPQSVNVKKGMVMNIDLTSKISVKEKEYEIAIPAGIVTNAEGDWNPSQTLCKFFYTEDAGVSSVFAGESNFRVYTIDGINVMNTTDRSKLSTLPKGIYIINGKKVLISK